MFNFPFKLFLKDRLIWGPFAFAFFLNLAVWLYLAFFIPLQVESIFLHYNIHFGVDLIGPREQIFSLPFLGWLAALLNFILSYFLYHREKKLSQLLGFATLVLQIFVAIEAVFLVFINR